MSDTSFEAEDSVSTPAKKLRHASFKSDTRQSPVEMNFAGHSPRKDTAELTNLSNSNELKKQEGLLEHQSTHATLLQPEHQHSSHNRDNMEEMIKKLLEGQTNMQKDIAKVIDKIDTVAALVNRVEAVEDAIQVVQSTQEELKQQMEKMSSQFRDMKDAQLRSMEHTFDNSLIFRGIPEKAQETALELKNLINQIIEKEAGISAQCTSAVRCGKTFNGTRPAKVYWIDQSNRNSVLRNSRKITSAKISKDLPMPVRKVQEKIKTRGWELRKKGVVDLDYHDLGLTIDGVFVHHEDIVLETKVGRRMDTS